MKFLFTPLILLVACSSVKKQPQCNFFNEIESLQARHLKDFFQVQSDAELDSIKRNSILYNFYLGDSTDQETVKMYKEKGNEILSDTSGQNEIAQRINGLVLPTKYQDRRTYFLAKTYLDSMYKPAKQLGVASGLNKIKFATLITTEINAEVYKCKCKDQEVIIFNQRLFDFCMMMSKIAASTIKMVEEKGKAYFDLDMDHISKNLQDPNDTVRIEFATDIRMFCKQMPPDQPYILNDYQTVLATNIMLACEYFAMAHEYTHVYLRHNNKIAQQFNADFLDSVAKKQRMLTRWHNELEADSLGLNLTMKYYEAKSNKLDYDKRYIDATAPLFFLKCLEILEKSSHIITEHNYQVYSPSMIAAIKEFTAKADSVNLSNINSDITSVQHPPAVVRYRALRNALVNQINSKNLSENELSQIRLGLALIEALELVYDLSKEVVLQTAMILDNK